MKKFLILLFAPLLMATQCDEDNNLMYATEFFIQNNSSIDLTYLTQDATELIIESNSSEFIAINTHTSTMVLPSENNAFNDITLYKPDSNGVLVTTYEQNPINDALWELSNPSPLDFEYTIIITDNLID